MDRAIAVFDIPDRIDWKTVEFETILCERTDSVGVITLNRPGRRNAFVPRMWLEMSTAFAAFDADDTVRAIVVTGAGDYFCVGADMETGQDTFRDRLGERSALLDEMKAPRAKPWSMSTPIIGAINGAAIGVGATLPLQWEIRIAAEDAKIGFAFVQRGAIPEANSHWLLPRLIGASRATELLLTGRTFTGADAAEFGLVTRAVARTQVFDEAMAVANQIAENVAPLSAALVKQLINAGMEEPDRIVAQRRENALFRWVAGQEDAREGVRSYLERRKPRWGVSKNLRPEPELPPP